MKSLKALRDKIDQIDQKISQLLEKRAKEVLEIKKIKKKHKLKVTDKTREKEILSRHNGAYQKEIFKKIISSSKKLQRSTLE